MQIKKIRIKNLTSDYSILIGNNILNTIPKKINKLCPQAKKIAIVLDKKVPSKFKKKLKKILEKYEVYTFEFVTSEKLKSFTNVNRLAEKLLSKNFNRSDILIAVGGGILGDFSAFVASIVKRGINFINIPTTLLSQVDSSIGGKTGVNSSFGKNLIGTFYEPKLVISDVSFLKSLPKREIVCGYAEILKHSLIVKNNFFRWLKINSKAMLEKRNQNILTSAIYKSCKVKVFFVNKDFREKGLRMTLNFGHTFAHAIEAKNKFSKKINHGEAVLIGMMLATKLSYIKRICTKKTLEDLKDIYIKNNINYDWNKFFTKRDKNKIVDFMNNDKKNNDKKINLILLKNIGKTTKPGEYKFTNQQLKNTLIKIN
ncbi:MAG: 3-dehydroquinate synthase [Pelagibacteraceae bacterium]